MKPHPILNAARAVRSLAARAASVLPGSSAFFGPPRRQAPSRDIHDFLVLKRHEIFPARIAHRPAVALCDPPIDQWMRAPGQADIKEIFVAELPRGRYWGRYHGYVIDRADHLLTDLSPAPDPAALRHDALTHIKLPPLREVHGVVAVINTLFASNFHHWLLDTLPRFEWLRRSGWALDKIDYFILPAKLRAHHHQTLALLGIDESRIILSSPNLHLRADLLLAPCHSEPGPLPLEYGYTPEGLRFVTGLLLKDNPFLQRTYPKRLVVSRQKAKSRRLVQAERAHAMLGKLGFEKVLLEDFSLQEQAALFRQAEAVVMPTGGGLANFAFCRPGTFAFELFSPNYHPPFTYSLLPEIQVRYYGLVADKVAQPFPGAVEADEDIDFNPDRLFEIVRDALR